MPTEKPSASLLAQPVHLIAFGFGAGLFPKAPGTAGTLLAVVPAWLIAGWSLQAKAVLIVALFIFGVWICGESARRLQSHDHPAIVWDEVVGYLATCLMLPAEPLWLLLAFVLFRFFDIVKPWPIRDLDHRLRGGIGIMLDDIVAAAFAAVCLLLVRLIPIV
jgi:phosphatidylglycerophosphatase A